MKELTQKQFKTLLQDRPKLQKYLLDNTDPETYNLTTTANIRRLYHYLINEIESK